MSASAWRSAVAGIAAVLLGAGAGELLAALFADASSPFAVVGGALIDVAPTWAKDTAIAWFGTSDKAALLVGIAIVLLALGALFGLGERRWRYSGVIGLAAVGIVVGVIALTRPDAGFTAWLPSVLAGAIAATALRLLARLTMSSSPTQLAEDPTPGGADRSTPPARSHNDQPSVSVSRRRFLAWAAGTAVAGVVLAVGGSIQRAGSTAVAAARDALKLPKAATASTAALVELDVDGLAPLITPNADFYRIDTAVLVPSVDPTDWSLRIHGMVEHEVTLTWDELLALPLTESIVTLSCVSNPVGGDLVGNARWLGYPIRELLARAVPSPDADMVLSTSIDGFTAGTPLEALTDERDALLAIGMNGEPLPLAHGFPVRMVVPGLYGYVSATKWVTELEVTRFDQARAYWTDRGWSARGPIKLQSRIDVPRSSARIDAGETVIAGVAWQPGTGISGVEVQVDDGPWQRAELGPAISDDTWVQWRLPWHAESGRHSIRCRAIDSTGTTQTNALAAPAPDGASGWHAIEANVS